APLRIAERRHAARGFVEHVPDLRLGFGDQLPVDADQVLAGVGLGAQLLDDGAVQLDAAGGDHLLGLAPRGDAGVGEDLLQALVHQRSPSPPVSLPASWSGFGPEGAAGSGGAFGAGRGAGGASTAAALFDCSSATAIARSSWWSAASLSCAASASFCSSAGSCARSVRPATGGAGGASSSTILRLSSERSWNSRSGGSWGRSRRLNSSRKP